MNGHFTVHEMSSSHLAHLPRIAGAFWAQATGRQSAAAADKKSSVRSRRLGLRLIPPVIASARLRRAAGYCSYFTPSGSLIEQLEIDRSQRMTARAYARSPSAACHLSLRQRAFSSGSAHASSLSSEQSGDITVIVSPER